MPKHNRPGRMRKYRLRRLFSLRTVRVIGVLVLAFFVWAAFSAGQALSAPNGGSASSKLAEWARGHYLGPVVTFGEWLTYNPPKAGGKPSFSLAVPSGEAVASSSTPPKPRDAASARAFRPVIPAALASLAGKPLPGEGQWRVLEKVHGRAGGLRDVLAGRDVHVVREWDRLHGSAACVIPVAPRQRGSRRQRLGTELATMDTARLADRPAGHVQRRLQAQQLAGRLLPERACIGDPGPGGRVGRLLQERHHQDRRVGPYGPDDLVGRGGPAEPQADR